MVSFGLGATRLAIEAALAASGCSGALTVRSAAAAPTDSGNLILDAALGKIPDAEDLAERLDRLPGVVEHGLFIGMASAAILATAQGVKVIGRPIDRAEQTYLRGGVMEPSMSRALP